MQAGKGLIGIRGVLQKPPCGFVTVEYEVFGKSAKYVNLEQFQVSEDFRGKRIGRKLFDLDCSEAKNLGAQSSTFQHIRQRKVRRRTRLWAAFRLVKSTKKWRQKNRSTSRWSLCWNRTNARISNFQTGNKVCHNYLKSFRIWKVKCL